MEDYVRDSNELDRAVERREQQAVRHPERRRAARTSRWTARTRPTSCEVDSATLVDRAHDLDVPGPALDGAGLLRREPGAAARRASTSSPSSCPARSRRRSAAASTARIAQMMQVFLASDVLLKSRYRVVAEATRSTRRTSARTLPTIARPDLRRGPPAGCSRPSSPIRSPGIRGSGGTAPRRACTATGSAACRSAASRSSPGAPRYRPADARHRVRRPGRQPGRQHRDRRRRDGDRRLRARTPIEARGDDPRDRCRRDEDT